MSNDTNDSRLKASSRSRGHSPSPLTHFSVTQPFVEEETEAQANLKNSTNVPFYKFVLTGGPCAGKTTALARLSSYLRQRGFEVMTAPEAFTTIINNGMPHSYFGVEGFDIVFQNSLMNIQESLEDGMEAILRAKGLPAILLCDRGLMDGAAYLSDERFNILMNLRNRQVTDLREARYNAVLHLVSAANGAEEYYSLDNNGARSESPEQAREVDKMTLNSWIGHPHLYVIDNQTGFEGKLQRVVERVARLVGLPTNLSRASVKFLLKSPPNLADFGDKVDFRIFEVEKAYMRSEPINGGMSNSSKYAFIRKRTQIQVEQDGRETPLGSVFGLTTVQKDKEDGTNMEVERIISRREYVSSMMQRDPARHVVKQRRISFLYNHQSFTIHIYKEPTHVKDLCVLYAQVETENSHDGEPQVNLPDFLQVERRVEKSANDYEDFGAFHISLIRD